MSYRDVEELLAERGIEASYESIRRWVGRFGPQVAAELRKREARSGRTWHLDEMAVRISGKQHWLWRAVDEHGITLEVLLQERRDTDAAERFFRTLLRNTGRASERITTDKLGSYAAAKQRISALSNVEHLQVRSALRCNNRVEQAHQPTRIRERRMGRFRCPVSAQRFLAAFARISNLFRPRRHLLPAPSTGSSCRSASPPGARRRHWSWADFSGSRSLRILQHGSTLDQSPECDKALRGKTELETKKQAIARLLDASQSGSYIMIMNRIVVSPSEFGFGD